MSAQQPSSVRIAAYKALAVLGQTPKPWPLPPSPTPLQAPLASAQLAGNLMVQGSAAMCASKTVTGTFGICGTGAVCAAGGGCACAAGKTLCGADKGGFGGACVDINTDS